MSLELVPLTFEQAGWSVVAELPPRSGWWTPSRPRSDRGTDGVARTLWEAS